MRTITLGVSLLATLLIAAPVAGQEQTHECFLMDATIVGTEGDDVITGTDDNDVIVGLGGDDTIDGGLGSADRVCGGDGNDELSDPDGSRLGGGPGSDTLSLGDSSSQELVGGTLDGGAGDDVLQTASNAGFTILRPDQGDDTVVGEGSTDWLEYFSSANPMRVDLARGTATGEGTDTITGIERLSGSRHDDRLAGDDGSDWLLGRSGRDVLVGRDGPDHLLLSGGSDRLEGGRGSDWVHTPRPDQQNYNINLARGRAVAVNGPTTRLASIENAFGGKRFIGTNGPNELVGEFGGDFFDGKRGDDVIKPGGRWDTVFAGRGDDRIEGCAGGRDRLHGGRGNDVIDPVGTQACAMFPGDDFIIDGGRGRDTVTYEQWWPERGAIVDLVRGACHNDCDDKRVDLRSLEIIVGSPEDDRLLGDGRANTLTGGAGDDVLNGRGGRDRLDGGDGTDDCRNGETVNRCE